MTAAAMACSPSGGSPVKPARPDAKAPSQPLTKSMLFAGDGISPFVVTAPLSQNLGTAFPGAENYLFYIAGNRRGGWETFLDHFDRGLCYLIPETSAVTVPLMITRVSNTISYQVPPWATLRDVKQLLMQQHVHRDDSGVHMRDLESTCSLALVYAGTKDKPQPVASAYEESLASMLESDVHAYSIVPKSPNSRGSVTVKKASTVAMHATCNRTDCKSNGTVQAFRMAIDDGDDGYEPTLRLCRTCNRGSMHVLRCGGLNCSFRITYLLSDGGGCYIGPWLPAGTAYACPDMSRCVAFRIVTKTHDANASTAGSTPACGVCRVALKPSEHLATELSSPACSHAFHSKCLSAWKSATCPACLLPRQSPAPKPAWNPATPSPMATAFVSAAASAASASIASAASTSTAAPMSYAPSASPTSGVSKVPLFRRAVYARRSAAEARAKLQSPASAAAAAKGHASHRPATAAAPLAPKHSSFHLPNKA